MTWAGKDGVSLEEIGRITKTVALRRGADLAACWLGEKCISLSNTCIKDNQEVYVLNSVVLLLENVSWAMSIELEYKAHVLVAHTRDNDI